MLTESGMREEEEKVNSLIQQWKNGRNKNERDQTETQESRGRNMRRREENKCTYTTERESGAM